MFISTTNLNGEKDVGRTSEAPRCKTVQVPGIILKASKQKIILHPLYTILIYNRVNLKSKSNLNHDFSFFSLSQKHVKGLTKYKDYKIKYFKIKITPLKTVVLLQAVYKKSTRGHQRQKARTNSINLWFTQIKQVHKILFYLLTYYQYLSETDHWPLIFLKNWYILKYYSHCHVIFLYKQHLCFLRDRLHSVISPVTCI